MCPSATPVSELSDQAVLVVTMYKSMVPAPPLGRVAITFSCAEVTIILAGKSVIGK
jgi:hypothetical protein